MKKQIKAIALLLAGAVLLGGCSMPRSASLAVKESADSSRKANLSGQEDGQSKADTADADIADETVYMVMKNDVDNYQITLMNLTSMAQICYEYTDGTEFFDKYGNYTPSESFSEGKLAVISRLNSNDTLGAIAFTEATWDYEDVINYGVDTEKSMITIADTSYRYDDSMRVFSDGIETDISAVGESDVLNMYGIGRTIYSVVVETGHGTLELTNTELFEGGWLNLGTKVYTTITSNMTMDIPEGIYEFSVANDGYGDTGEIRIRRDKTTTIDLNDYKGEGPKICKLTFDVGVEDAILTVNGKEVDYSAPLELRYGVYRLGVYASGYDNWTKQLVINSPTAKIDILLTDEKEASDKEKEDNKEKDNSSDKSSDKNSSGSSSGKRLAGSKAGSLAGSYSGSSSADDSGDGSNNDSSSSLANAALNSSLANIITGGDSTDYLDTLSDLIKSLDRLNNRSSDND